MVYEISVRSKTASSSEFDLFHGNPHSVKNAVKELRLQYPDIQPFIGNPFIEVIDRRLIDEYLNKRTEEVSKSTVNIELRHLKAAFTLAVQWCYVDQNPFQGVKPLSIPQRTPTFFTEEQMTALLEKVEEPLRQTVIFAVNTGVRIGGARKYRMAGC